WGLFVVMLMRWLRRALQDDVTARVQAMARASEGEDLPPVRHPAMVELREVAQIISHTHERVRATAAEHQSRIESLELELNQDAVTGLANRKYFINELRRLLEQSEPGQGEAGHVMLFRQCDLQSINQTMSRQVVDQWLRNMGQLVLEVLRERLGPQAWLARLNGSDFAFILPMMPGRGAAPLGQRSEARGRGRAYGCGVAAGRRPPQHRGAAGRRRAGLARPVAHCAGRGLVRTGNPARSVGRHGRARPGVADPARAGR